MIIHRLLPVALVRFATLFQLSDADPSADARDALASGLLHWLRANGAHVNEKVAPRRPDGAVSAFGIFASGAMAAGETAFRVPWPLILKPGGFLSRSPNGTSAEMSDCETIAAVREAMAGEGGTPYGRYLLAQPRAYPPGFWSRAARDLLEEMLWTGRADDELPPHDVDDVVDGDLKGWCGGDVDDPLYLHAAMLVKARADYELMVPLYDMLNHHNGQSNVRHKHNPYGPLDDVRAGYEIVTTRAVAPGEELLLSYNQCDVCGDRRDWFGTPEMFLHYGFVESLPRRWLFDFARVKFDLDHGPAGGVEVNFLVPPSGRGIDLLREELARLRSFSAARRGMDYEEAGIREGEWSSLWQYHDALRDALSRAVESETPLSDDVWYQDDDWWVADGSITAADTDEHRVHPTARTEL